MAKYIDKERVVSLIKERRDAATSRQKNLEKIGDKSVLNEMVAFNLDKILETIDTLEVKEVKEVNLDMEINLWVRNLHRVPNFEELNKFAKHFFELGLKTKE